jgi:hypothetical protein
MGIEVTAPKDLEDRRGVCHKPGSPREVATTTAIAQSTGCAECGLSSRSHSICRAFFVSQDEIYSLRFVPISVPWASVQEFRTQNIVYESDREIFDGG